MIRSLETQNRVLGLILLQLYEGTLKNNVTKSIEAPTLQRYRTSRDYSMVLALGFQSVERFSVVSGRVMSSCGFRSQF